ncbi:putative glycosyltransferase [Oligella urethralis]|uniref:glycosyltransferase family 2 protein n=2 Tax=Oligella urethralis TaxID=90245 RepID=UPI0029587CFA|nr:glycosyltransferase family 2 protein [Oligella urethralis]WOS36812.1 putative glycosyltransferase [Oligella urethralis]
MTPYPFKETVAVNQQASVALSLVIPVYNEKPVIPLLLERLKQVMSGIELSYEIVLVDDGSRDGSGELMYRLALSDPSLHVLRLSRNFGKEAALTAGLDHARGEAVIIMDADLQDPPELIPQMVAHWREGYDVVSMKRRSREGETRFKTWSAHCYYRMLNKISDVDIPTDTGDFRLLSRHALEALKQLPERNRYMKGLFAWIGMKTKVVEYDRQARVAGKSKWDYFALVGLAFEGITSFSRSPLRLAMGLGVFIALAGVLFGLWIVFKTLMLGEVVPGYPSIIALVTFLGGVQLMTVGLLGEYVGKIYYESKQRPIYLLSDAVEQAQACRPAYRGVSQASPYVATVHGHPMAQSLEPSAEKAPLAQRKVS